MFILRGNAPAVLVRDEEESGASISETEGNINNMIVFLQCQTGG